MKQTKYIYYKIIQTNHGYGWDDEDWYEVDSQWRFANVIELEKFRVNKRAYQKNVQGQVRVISRRELRTQ